MYKVVIIDDEVWITQLIKNSINWEELDMSVIAITNDGEAGFDLITEHKPDIVITDIRVPGMDGLELINKVQENGLNTNFIIISGYQDFEYAKKAIEYGVNNYITKPIEEEELFNSLKEIKEKLRRKNEKELEEQKLKKKLSNSVDLIKNQFLLDLIINNKYSFQQEYQDYALNFDGKLFQIVLLKIDSRTNNKISLNYRTLLYDNLSNIISKLEENINIIAQINKIICIFNFNEGEQSKIYKTINYIFNQLKQSLINVTHKISITCAIGSIEDDLSKLNKSYLQAERSLRARVSLGTNRIISSKDLNSFVNINTKDILSTERIKQYTLLIELFDIEKIKVWISDTLNIFVKNKNINPYFLIDISLEIIELTYKEIENLNIQNNKKIDISEVKEILDSCLTVNDIIVKLTDIVINIMKDSKDINNLDNRKPIEVAKEYISNHYNENISLQDISSKVYLNPTYFSELFKKEVGVNFSDYLINYRLDIARELLQNPKYKISQVSKKVGYNDSRYFSKLFKKVVGVTPKQYRKLYI